MGYSAILLVGGFGTRLHPLTKRTPKPMLSVAGVPFLEHQIVQARDAGISEIVLATSFLAETFEPYFGDGSRFDIAIRYAVEEHALGTAGAIKNASKQLTGSGPVVIFNGDVLSAHNLQSQISFHQESEAAVTLYLTSVADARAYGAVELDENKRVLAFNEKMENPPTNTINAGCYIFSREIFDEIPEGKVVSVEREIFPKLLAAGVIVMGYVDEAYWLDIGTPQALLKASQDLVTGVIYSSATPIHEGEFLVLDNSQIAESATLDRGTVIGSGSIVESNSYLSGCIIGSGVKVNGDCTLINCFVADNYEIPAGTIAEFSFFNY